MLATHVSTTRWTSPLAPPATSSAVAVLIFEALGRLHGMHGRDAELLDRAAAGLHFIRSTDRYSSVEHQLFALALSQLNSRDACVVEAAACCAADLGGGDDTSVLWDLDMEDRRRALWLAAMLRISEALCCGHEGAPAGAYASWTPDLVYIEFDGDGITKPDIERTRARVAALEAVSGRRVVLASANSRRGAA